MGKFGKTRVFVDIYLYVICYDNKIQYLAMEHKGSVDSSKRVPPYKIIILFSTFIYIAILTITRILVKLTIFPFHKPTYLFLSVGAEVVIIFLLVLPKVPYLIFSAYLNPLTIVLLTVLRILIISNNNSKENLAYSI